MKHLIDIRDITTDEIEQLIEKANDIIKNPEKYREKCKYKKLATLFFEPSTRTRLSFEAAMMELGGNVLGFSEAQSSSASKGESVSDTVKVVSCYADIIAMRHPKEGAPMVASFKSDAPIINAGDGGHNHPTQTLTDLLTIKRKKGKLSDITVGFCGDLKFGRTVHSLIAALSRYENVKFVLISPDELKVPGYIRKDVVSANLGKDVGTENGYDLWHVSLIKGIDEKLESQYGFDIITNRPEEQYHISNTASAGGNAISADCEYPEVAMKFLNLIYTEQGKDLYRMLVYGLEGEHYTKISDDTIEPIGYTGSQGNADAPYGIYKWLCGNTMNAFQMADEPEDWNDYVFNDLHANATKSRIAGFKPDITNIDNEIKLVSAAISEYLSLLTSGALEDWEAKYAEFEEKLRVSGNDKIIAELQKQIDEFIANSEK